MWNHQHFFWLDNVFVSFKRKLQFCLKCKWFAAWGQNFKIKIFRRTFWWRYSIGCLFILFPTKRNFGKVCFVKWQAIIEVFSQDEKRDLDKKNYFGTSKLFYSLIKKCHKNQIAFWKNITYQTSIFKIELWRMKYLIKKRMAGYLICFFCNLVHMFTIYH